MPDNQIAIPVPQECWQRISGQWSPHPIAHRPVLIAVPGGKIAGFFDGAFWRDGRGTSIREKVLAYLDPGPYIPPPPPVEVGQVRVSPTGVRVEVRRLVSGGCNPAVTIHLDETQSIWGYVTSSALATWPIAEGTA